VPASSGAKQSQKLLYPWTAIVLQQIVSKEDSFGLTQIFIPVLQNDTDRLITWLIFCIYRTGVKSLKMSC
jgi:hypothetical protein